MMTMIMVGKGGAEELLSVLMFYIRKYGAFEKFLEKSL